MRKERFSFQFLEKEKDVKRFGCLSKVQELPLINTVVVKDTVLISFFSLGREPKEVLTALQKHRDLIPLERNRKDFV